MSDPKQKDVIENLIKLIGGDPSSIEEFIKKYTPKIDPVRSTLDKSVAETVRLLIEISILRDKDSKSFLLTKNAASLLLQVWVEEEGEEFVGKSLRNLYSSFDEYFSYLKKEEIEMAKSSVYQLIEELDFVSYLSDNPLSSKEEIEEVEDIGPF